MSAEQKTLLAATREAKRSDDPSERNRAAGRQVQRISNKLLAKAAKVNRVGTESGDIAVAWDTDSYGSMGHGADVLDIHSADDKRYTVLRKKNVTGRGHEGGVQLSIRKEEGDKVSTVDTYTGTLPGYGKDWLSGSGAFTDRGTGGGGPIESLESNVSNAAKVLSKARGHISEVEKAQEEAGSQQKAA